MIINFQKIIQSQKEIAKNINLDLNLKTNY